MSGEKSRPATSGRRLSSAGHGVYRPESIAILSSATLGFSWPGGDPAIQSSKSRCLDRRIKSGDDNRGDGESLGGSVPLDMGFIARFSIYPVAQQRGRA
jgi:hypothetical protein